MQPLLKGRPHRLAILDYGLFQVHANGRVIGICGYVVQTTAGETVLIDTGFPPKYAEDAAAASTEDDLNGFGRVLSLGPENLATAQLAKLGLGTGDIDLMIQSHTHIDHVGFMDAFPDVPIVIAAAERALPRPLYWSGKQAMEWPLAEYLTVRGDFDAGPGFRVFLVPGHAPGQLAFLLELPETGPVLLTSDAISRAEEIDERFAGSWDEVMAIENGARLMQIAKARDAMVIFGHSPEQWSTLRKAPHWYD
ncbi:N-acyl homoserine lactonase family protein [uncultured Roseobacter sp.]|uniref:N-acyl homoserine lactonase family protein n=1 Tax=uncultured Roseobacter sp. TaxID=114847 RepID=UPI002637A243|nr:N-acyl homoserine lactonase family protein [uncultured Roseobacter sp.]